jgi:hypothetical protein
MKINIEEIRAKVAAQTKADKILVAFLIEKGDYLDEDGYPTDDALTIIKLWHWDDFKGWFKFIENIWHLRSWGWSEGLFPEENGFDIKDKQRYQYHISTAGWSGNEDIIRSMEKNDMMWSLAWVQSRRGGHYIFEDRELE